MSEGERCDGSGQAPTERREAPSSKAVGRCPACGAWVYTRGDLTVKQHNRARGEQA